MTNGHNTQSRIAKLLAVLAIAVAEAHAKDQDKVARRERRIVVSIPDRKLAVVDRDDRGVDRVVKVYNIAVGKTSTPSPQGQFAVVNRIPNPTWYGPEKIVPPGKGNPLGTRWMGLNVGRYGIHGTNVPTSIGKAASHGCIRMRNADVEDLFELVREGMTVELAGDRPVLFAKLYAVSVALGD